MKKFAIGFIAIAVAVIGFSFTTEENKQTDYIWFHVKNGTSKLCNNFTSVVPADLDLVPVSSSDPITDLQAQQLQVSEAVTFFGCPAATYVCAVGFPVQASAFETVTIDGTQYWRPKTTTGELEKICRTNP